MTTPDTPEQRRSSIPAFTASAARIRIPTRPNEQPIHLRTQRWQHDGWLYYEEIGEVQHSIDFVANSISKVQLFGALVPNDPRSIPAFDPDPTASAAITALKTEGGEYGAILRELAINLYVAGECFLVARDTSDNAQANLWEIRSTDEIRMEGSEWVITDYPSGPRKTYADDKIIVIHILFNHPRYGGLPISPIRGILASCAEVRRIEQVIRNAARSRSAGPGLLLIPEEISFNTLAPANDGDETTDKFMSDLVAAMMTPLQNEDDPSAVVPMIVRAPSDTLDKIRRVDLAPDINTELLKLERALTRIAQGLPLPPEIVSGKGALSHWTAWNVDESTITGYIEPVLAPIVNALTIEYYRPYLIASGMSETEASKRMLWYDVTRLITRPNRSADADYGLEHIALSDESWRKIKGFGNEDAPKPIEKLARLLLQRGSLDPISTVTLLKVLGIVPEDAPVTNIQQPPTPGPPHAVPPTDQSPPDMTRPRSSSPPRSSALMILPPTTPDHDLASLQLSELDRELRIRLQTAAESAVSTALQRASSKIASKFRRKAPYSTIIRDTAHLELAKTLGRATLEAEDVVIADLFSGSFDTLATKFRDWTARTYTRAFRIIGTNSPTPIDEVSSAADALISDLTFYSTKRLFAEYAADPYGEISDTNALPHGIVRRALYHAGGGQRLIPSDDSPAGLIATGRNVLSALLAAGGHIEGWEWVYATTMRAQDFEPHAALDGVRFSSFSDRVLANPGTWPPVPLLYPGDHDHCACTVRALITLPPPPASVATTEAAS